jgi:hypothetical protein
MDYLDFIGNIRFRFIKPHTPIIPIRCCRYTQGLRIAFFLEVLNTRLAYREREIRSVLRRICGVPKMSTFAIGALINQAVSQMPENQAFVNVGVWHGLFGRPREAFLERFNHHKGPEHFFHKMDYVDYFSEVHNEPIGFYIYDGNHNYDSQLVGLKVAEPFLSENSIILIDDANYDMVRESTKDYISDSSYEYEVVLDQNTFCNYHPTFWNGVIVLQRVK